VLGIIVTVAIVALVLGAVFLLTKLPDYINSRRNS